MAYKALSVLPGASWGTFPVFLACYLIGFTARECYRDIVKASSFQSSSEELNDTELARDAGDAIDESGIILGIEVDAAPGDASPVSAEPTQPSHIIDAEDKRADCDCYDADTTGLPDALCGNGLAESGDDAPVGDDTNAADHTDLPLIPSLFS